MKIIDTITQKIDNSQRKHPPLAFLHAVAKKFTEDQAGYQAALVTYYGFLSIFPLLLVLTTVAGIAGSRDPELAGRLVSSVSNYFPVAGQALSNSVNNVERTGLALVIGLLFSLYGARGVADSFRNAVNHIWHIPMERRSRFPRALLRSVALILGGGFGFVAASAITIWVSAVGHGWPFRVLAIALNLAVLYLVFVYILRLSLPLKVPVRKFRVGAITSAAGLTLIQTVGSIFFIAQAKSLTDSYSAIFATTLGMLAWIYLQAQVLMFAVETDTVINNKYWPRSLSGNNPTAADKAISRPKF